MIDSPLSSGSLPNLPSSSRSDDVSEQDATLSMLAQRKHYPGLSDAGPAVSGTAADRQSAWRDVVTADDLSACRRDPRSRRSGRLIARNQVGCRRDQVGAVKDKVGYIPASAFFVNAVRSSSRGLRLLVAGEQEALHDSE
jgi:hypothetical protein